MAFWDMKSCTLVSCYQRFGGTYASIFRFEVQLLCIWGQDVLPKRRKLTTTFLSVSVENGNSIAAHETCCL
jgi:hypothetical protein